MSAASKIPLLNSEHVSPFNDKWDLDSLKLANIILKVTPTRELTDKKI